MLFLEILKMTQSFLWPCMIISWHLENSLSLEFYRVFSVKKAGKWPDMSQCAYGVESRSNHTWMPNMGMPTFLQNLGSFLRFHKIPCSTESVLVAEKGPFGSTPFLDIP